MDECNKLDLTTFCCDMEVVSETQNDRIDTSDERTCRKRKNEINGKEKWFVFNSIFKEERYE